MRYKSSLLAAAAVVVGGIGLQWLLPYPTPSSQEVRPPQLPEAILSEKADVLETILANNLWDQHRGQGSGVEANSGLNGESGQGMGAEQLANSVSWELLGVSRQGAGPLAVIRVGGDIASYRVGADLPDGSRLVEIMPHGVQVSRLGTDKRVYLFEKK